MLRTFKLTIAYDGTEYSGWQVQPGEATIQGTLQDALAQISPAPVQVIGSGRTDSGVHAIAQAASCRLAWRDPANRLAKALNSHLPETIVVTNAVDAPDDFHAIRDATGKRYRYKLQIGGIRDPFGYRYHWHIRGTLAIEPMRAAAERFVGRFDFASFQAAGSDRKTTVRNLRRCDLITQRRDEPDRIDMSIDVEADGFLYNMVRNIVGTLVEVGRCKQPPQWIDEVIAARDRDAAGPTAPAHGLFLHHVDYDDTHFGNQQSK